MPEIVVDQQDFSGVKEQIILDPDEVADNRVELNITELIRSEGVDWGDAEIAAYMADMQRGSVPVDYRIPNRNIEIALRLLDTDDYTFYEARSKIAAKVALFQREGGWLKRELRTGEIVYCDIANATLHLAGDTIQQLREADITATLNLEAIPDFYGDEITLADHTETSATEVKFVETDIKGDYPGRLRLIVDEDDGDAQLGLICSLRSRHYSAASTAAPFYEAEALEPLDSAGTGALAGASGGNVVSHTDLSTSWTPVLGTNVGGSTFLTHTGNYRVWARCYSPDGEDVTARLVWDVGDLVNPAENASVTMPGAAGFYMLDFGEVRLSEVPVGTHRWAGQFQFKGTDGGEIAMVDKVWFFAIDDGYTVLRAPQSLMQGLVDYSARSEFNTESGAITGDSLSTGGTWTAVTGSDADDFTASGGVATRTSVSDTGTLPMSAPGRVVIANSVNLTDCAVAVDLARDGTSTSVHQGVVTRVADTDLDDAIYAYARHTVLGWLVGIDKVIGGARTEVISGITQSGPALDGDDYWRLTLAVSPAGLIRLWWNPQGAQLGDPMHTETDSALPSTGSPGIYDSNTAAGACTRHYANFAVWVPPADAVLNASQSAELRWDGHFREDAAGAAYGPVSHVVGDLLRLPPEGLESRSVEVMVKGSRGDLDTLPDSGIDNISARAYYRPSYIHVP